MHGFFRYYSLKDFCFRKFCKAFLVLCINVVTEAILNLIDGNSFSLEVPFIVSGMAKQGL